MIIKMKNEKQKEEAIFQQQRKNYITKMSLLISYLVIQKFNEIVFETIKLCISQST